MGFGVDPGRNLIIIFTLSIDNYMVFISDETLCITVLLKSCLQPFFFDIYKKKNSFIHQ